MPMDICLRKYLFESIFAFVIMECRAGNCMSIVTIGGILGFCLCVGVDAALIDASPKIAYLLFVGTPLAVFMVFECVFVFNCVFLSACEVVGSSSLRFGVEFFPLSVTALCSLSICMDTSSIIMAAKPPPLVWGNVDVLYEGNRFSAGCT